MSRARRHSKSEIENAARVAALPSADDLYDDAELWASSGAGGGWPAYPDSYLYFLSDRRAGLVRIGITVNLSSRFSAHQSSSAAKLEWLGDMPGGRTLERRFHQAFSYARAHGSWYTAHPALLETIERVVTL